MNAARCIRSVAALALVLVASSRAEVTPETSNSNDTAATAQSLVTTFGAARVRGNLRVGTDQDWYSFTANAGDRVYAATITSGFPSSFGDSVLALVDGDGSTVIESDNDDGSFNDLGSSIAGRVLAHGGTFYLRVTSGNAGAGVEPYELYLSFGRGGPRPSEAEPNDGAPGQPLSATGDVAGAISSAADIDSFSVTLQAGDTLFASLDLDPDRAGSWDGQISVGNFAGRYVTAHSATAAPSSQALALTVRDAGTYTLVVSSPSGVSGTYALGVAVLRDLPLFSTTYAGVDVPKTLPAGNAPVASQITAPAGVRIEHLRLAMDFTGTNLSALLVTLTSPAGNEVIVAGGAAAPSTTLHLVLDPDAALPLGTGQTLDGVVYRSSTVGDLRWFDGEDAAGTWTLKMRDTSGAGGGVLVGWNFVNTTQYGGADLDSAVFSADFEPNDGGFTHSGANDQWGWGTPNSAPITTAAGGSKCWKTNLAGNYANNANEDLVSPAIGLVNLHGAAILRWSMKYQLEPSVYDQAWVEVREDAGAAVRRVWESHHGDMLATALGQAVSQSAGWGRYEADISDFVGKTVRIVFHLGSDTIVNRAGLAIDDVSVLRRAGSAVLTGFAYRDDDRDRRYDPDETVLPGVSVSLTGQDDLGQPVSVNATTGADGVYYVSNVPPSGAGGYDLSYGIPAGFLPGLMRAGSFGGTPNSFGVSGIVVNASGFAFGYDMPLVEDAPGGDRELYVKSGLFTVDWAKHVAGKPLSDRWSIAGVMNTNGFPASLAGTKITFITNGNTDFASGTLDTKGTARSNGTPAVNFRVNPKTGAFSFALAKLDMTQHLGLVDADASPGTAKFVDVFIRVEFPGEGPRYYESGPGFLYGSVKGHAAFGSFAFKRNVAAGGVFVATKLTAVRAATGGYSYSFSGQIEPAGGLPVVPTGDLTLKVGHVETTIPFAKLVRKGAADATSVFTLPAGAAAGFRRFSLNNAARTLSFVTGALPETQFGIDQNDFTTPLANDTLVVRLAAPTASGTLRFATITRLKRPSVSAPIWSR